MTQPLVVFVTHRFANLTGRTTMTWFYRPHAVTICLFLLDNDRLKTNCLEKASTPQMHQAEFQNVATVTT